MTYGGGSYLARAVADRHATIQGTGRDGRITYVAIDRTERLSDPEERVRAEYWAELVYRYGYEPSRIGIEVTVPDRTPKDAADIVVFRDDTRKNPYAVIECKRERITDAEFNQAVEQAAGNGTWSKFRADYVGVVAGLTRRFLDFTGKYGVLEREANIVADLPHQYGRPEEFKYRRDGDQDIQPVTQEELIIALDKCHQTLWAGGRLSPPAAFGELCKLIFVKIADEKEPRRVGEPYQFQIKTHEASHRLGERIRDLYKKAQEVDSDVFAEPIKIDDSTLRTIVSHLESINLSDSDPDVKGLAFEKFMDSFFKGDFGQYFTPRPIVRFAVELFSPKNSDKVLDPACGSGGFLLEALEVIRAEANDLYEDSTKRYAYWKKFADSNLFGIEINDELVRVAKMNMILHEDGHSNVIGADALDRIDRLREVNNKFGRDKFDLVLTNPPFGAQVSLASRPYLADYKLGQAAKAGGSQARRAQKTEILFVERVWDFLKPGTGRAAIVLPDGILSNASLQYVRDFILERFEVIAIISLPQYAFYHFGAAVKSSLMFLRKRAKDESPGDDELTFMGAPQQIGYDATGRVTDNDFPQVIAAFREFQQHPEKFIQ
jgi:type I restriction enzyme M protein